jgi:hypothetical protein
MRTPNWVPFPDNVDPAIQDLWMAAVAVDSLIAGERSSHVDPTNAFIGDTWRESLEKLDEVLVRLSDARNLARDVNEDP